MGTKQTLAHGWASSMSALNVSRNWTMNTSNKQPDWKRCAKLAYDFLDSLPNGWLAHTSGNVGLLNEFYIEYKKTQREASNLNPVVSNAVKP